MLYSKTCSSSMKEIACIPSEAALYRAHCRRFWFGGCRFLADDHSFKNTRLTLQIFSGCSIESVTMKFLLIAAFVAVAAARTLVALSLARSWTLAM